MKTKPTEAKRPFEELARIINDNFDYEKVYKVMKALDWTWRLGDERYGIPDLNTIRKSANRLLHEVYDRGGGTVASGGFRALYEDGHLWLGFSVEEWDTCSDD